MRTLDEMIAAIRDVGEIWPDECRHRIETRFSSKAMADGYEELYQKVIDETRESSLLAA